MNGTTLTVIQVLQRIKAKYGEQVTEEDVATVKAIAGMDAKTINALMIFMWGAFQGGIQNNVTTSIKQTNEKLQEQEENYILPMMDDINQLNSDVSSLSGEITQLWNAIASISQG